MKKSRKFMKRSKVGLVSFLLAISCLLVTSCNYNNERVINWRNDFDYLSEELPKKHIDLYFKLQEEEFKSKITTIKRNIPKLNDDEIMVELMKLIAAVGDEHTVVGYFNDDILPVKLYWFEEGVYVIDAAAEYSEIIQCRLSKINGIDISEIVEAVDELIPHANKQWVKCNMPSILISPNVLHGMGIADSKDKVTFTLINNEGAEFDIDINTIKLDRLNWANSFNEEVPLYRKNSDKYYWYEYLEDHNAIYYKHNVCYDQEGNPFMDFSINLFDAIKEKSPNKLFIDLRNNSGGDDRYVNNIITKINLMAPELNEKGKLYIIIGRETFSSAVLNSIYAKNNSEAIFIGEATGGKPNGYGGVQLMELPNSKIKVQYSAMKFDSYDKEVDTFEPDINVKISVADYFQNRDPILETILNKNN